MTRQLTFTVYLAYPTHESPGPGLAAYDTWRSEQWHYPTRAEAEDQFKRQCLRLAGLRVGAQVDLIGFDGYVLASKAHLPDPIAHPLVADLEAKMRARGQRP